mmetsp:Transcript_3933/g.10372  ORF Transcript_3933/g.10372 Transcript_3933/m.10372 type:complete len:387 (-) Transcript_3933:103-1263(-)
MTCRAAMSSRSPLLAASRTRLRSLTSSSWTRKWTETRTSRHAATARPPSTPCGTPTASSARQRARSRKATQIAPRSSSTSTPSRSTRTSTTTTGTTLASRSLASPSPARAPKDTRPYRRRSSPSARPGKIVTVSQRTGKTDAATMNGIRRSTTKPEVRCVSSTPTNRTVPVATPSVIPMTITMVIQISDLQTKHAHPEHPERSLQVPDKELEASLASGRTVHPHCSVTSSSSKRGQSRALTIPAKVAGSHSTSTRPSQGRSSSLSPRSLIQTRATPPRSRSGRLARTSTPTHRPTYTQRPRQETTACGKSPSRMMEPGRTATRTCSASSSSTMALDLLPRSVTNPPSAHPQPVKTTCLERQREEKTNRAGREEDGTLTQYITLHNE